MKIMLIGSIRKRKVSSDTSILKIVNILKNLKHTVIYKHIIDTTQKKLDEMSDAEDLKFHSNILKNIRDSDIIISECSEQSLSVGYLLSHASDLGKPVIIFYLSSSKEPNLFPSLTKSGKLFLVEYTDASELKKLLIEYINYACDEMNTRFNMMLSPKLSAYLKEASTEERVSKATIIRRLLREKRSKT